MKKSLIALAVLAASGAAMAQSSVTIYGIADVWFGNVKAETAGNTGVANTSLTQTKLQSGIVNGSRWGIKGSEDLGGGLKANFNLEQGFAMDDGTAGSLGVGDGSTTAVKTYPFAFSRQSWVGFSGDFGAVRLGRTTTPFDDVNGASDAVFDSQLSPMNKDLGLGVFRSTGYQARPNNTIYYQAPTFNGFSGALSYSLGENKDTAAPAGGGVGVGAGSVISLNVTYAAGPVAAQLGYQAEKDNGAAETVKYTRLGVSYDFGPAKLLANYGKVNNFRSTTIAVGANLGVGVAGNDATEWQLGVDVPVSAALILSANYAKSSDSAAAAVDADRKGYGLGAKYILSKRTFIYGGYGSATTSNLAGKNDKTNNTYGVGVQHRF